MLTIRGVVILSSLNLLAGPENVAPLPTRVLELELANRETHITLTRMGWELLFSLVPAEEGFVLFFSC